MEAQEAGQKVQGDAQAILGISIPGRSFFWDESVSPKMCVFLFCNMF